MRPILIIAGWIAVLPLQGQYLLLDRGLKGGAATAPSAGLEASEGTGFLTDRFSVGAAGEVWIIDRVRLWGGLGTSGFEKAALFGGLENADPSPQWFECDCHNLVAISQDPHASQLPDRSWQVYFDHLNWSVPGGVGIRFGIRALQWSMAMVHTGTAHQIKRFDENGKLIGPHGAESDAGFAVQVWGHLPASIEIRPAGEQWEVRLASALHADPASYRFGSQQAAPVRVRAEGDAVVLTFRAADTGIHPEDVNACLHGQRQDGVPFEGCGLLKKGR
jgi:hypothetical protein